MSDLALLDTNVLLRHVLHDHADHSPRATAIIAEIERGERRVRLADTVVFEAVFTLEKHYRVPREQIRESILPLVQLPGAVLPGKRIYEGVFERYLAHRTLSFADSYHLGLADHLHLAGIITFDARMNRLPDVTILQPAPVQHE